MKRKQYLNKPVAVSELTEDDLYEEAGSQWQQKAARLQARRWRKLRHQTV